MQRLIMQVSLGLLAAVFFVAAASAAGPAVPWRMKDMKTAIHAIGYPKPHPKKLACKGSGPTSSGEFTSFRCVATYKQHRRNVFFIAGQGEGGWLCAGKTLAECKLLRHGFLTNGDVAPGGLSAAADLTARGYMSDRYGTYQPTGFCSQTASLKWACGFHVASGDVTLALSMRKTPAGYVTSASVN